ncbi:hypothetical protein EC973_002753 [Apophysomyces ossiformis]|uniref:Arrestin-like N-terminal domain-containing protein n=1 Tax=Apophysomyces ossiformis TaxID=679940 RepID=A0A8H7C009_9FUNG|nr:hypothetical protein EC973_002753 [Apophysomyces ossiformis]
MSKDGFQSVEIEPLNGYVDFLGSTKPACTTSLCSRLLEGEARLSLTKPVKIRHIVVKFKGCSSVCLGNNMNVHTPLLPKLKVQLFNKTTTLPAGNHRFPWELEIPNLYPRSLELKRASVQYKVEISVTFGLHKTITAEYPIVVRRHQLLCKELAPLIETKSYQNTLAGKFHFEFEAPRIICYEQGTIPMAIKYLCFAKRRVRSIRTQLLQIELYRSQSISKSEADLENVVKHNRNSKIRYAKYVRRLSPAMIHHVEGLSPWQEPLVLHHRMDQNASTEIESPLVSVYHQIEIIFQFGQKFEDVRAKLPTVVSSLGPQKALKDGSTPKYPFEIAPLTKPLSVRVDTTNKPQPRPCPPGGYLYYDDYEAEDNCNYDDEGDDHTKPEWVDQHAALLDVTRSSFHLTCEDRPLKRCASAQDLYSSKLAGADCPPPRSITPTPRREVRRRPQLRPLDIDLANGKKNKTRPALVYRPSSPIISPIQALSTHQGPCSRQGHALVLTSEHPWSSTSGSLPDPWLHLADSDSEVVSIYSDSSSSSHAAPSLCSSVTGASSYKSQSLHSRPPSPVFSNAPGLPATIPLRSQDSVPVALVEESFAPSPSISNFSAIPSSNLFSPSTHDLLLSRAAQLTRESSVIDPNEVALQHAISPVQHDDAAIKHHYSKAALPPLPTTPTTATTTHRNNRQRRRTVYYAEDSDDDQIDPLPPIAENDISCTLHKYPSNNSPVKIQRKPSNPPPRLPRLSLGTAFDVSFTN